MENETYSCAACCAETENEPQAICDTCDKADRDAAAARLNGYRDAITEMVEAYGEMEKGIEDPILCHYNGLRLHNAMEDLRALVLPGYEPKYEPQPERLIENGIETPAGEAFFNRD